MNIRPRAEETLCLDNPDHPPTQARFARAYFLPWGCSCPRPTGAALAQPRNTPAMSSETAWKARYARLWNAAEKADAPYRALSHQRVMVALEAYRQLALPGSPGPAALGRSPMCDGDRQPCPGRAEGRRRMRTAARRCSAPAAPCRWTATPRPASRPTRAPGAAGTASRASKGPITRAFLDVLEALLWGFHNSPLRLLLSRATRRSPRRRNAPAARWPRR